MLLKYTYKIIKFKARLVAHGYRHRYTLTTVSATLSIRMIFAIPAFKNMIIYEMNIDTAFLNAVLVKTISMAAPDGTTVGSDECLLLKKSLYGLKHFIKT